MASSPGFGYIFFDQPHIAVFQQVGQRFFISYLPKTTPETLEGQKIGLWLGPDFLKQEMMVFLIWPGRGIIPFGTPLCARQPSRLVTIGKDVGSFETHPPNVIIYELLHFNQQPCMLFTLWSNLPSAVVNDARSLSFATLVEKWINDLVRFMEDASFDGWDSAPAGQLHTWYDTSMKTLRQSDASTLQSRHRFDINKSGKSKSSVLIPLDFIRDWRDELLRAMCSDTATMRALLTPA